MLQIKPAADGKFTATELWKNKMMKTQFNSPVVRDGYIYGLDDGLLACVDLNTGHRVWKDGRYGSGQSLLVDDLILIQSEPGPVVLAKASPDGFAELGRVPALSAKTWNYPTLAGKYLLLRNDQEVACYEVPVQATPQVASLIGERAAK
jgi:outer membrane protein assembly factor BamB